MQGIIIHRQNIIHHAHKQAGKSVYRQQVRKMCRNIWKEVQDMKIIRDAAKAKKKHNKNGAGCGCGCKNGAGFGCGMPLTSKKKPGRKNGAGCGCGC